MDLHDNGTMEMLYLDYLESLRKWMLRLIIEDDEDEEKEKAKNES